MDYNIPILLALISVIVNSFAHICLKRYMLAYDKTNIKNKTFSDRSLLQSWLFSKIKEFFWLIIGIFLFILCMITSMYSLKNLDLKNFYSISSFTYILTPILSILLLNEIFVKKNIVAYVIITIGIIIFNIKIL